MDLEDQWLTRDQAIAQRDIHRKAADEWLSRLALAILAGNGAALIAIANSRTIADGTLLVRAIALLVSIFFLAGAATSLLSIMSQRNYHIGRSLYFAKHARRMDFDKHFVPAMEPKEAAEFKDLLQNDLMHTEQFSIDSGDTTERYLRYSMRASILGIFALIGLLLLAPATRITASAEGNIEQQKPVHDSAK